jgi:hypothetical protein
MRREAIVHGELPLYMESPNPKVPFRAGHALAPLTYADASF